jgi:hypothetical protein
MQQFQHCAASHLLIAAQAVSKCTPSRHSVVLIHFVITHLLLWRHAGNDDIITLKADDQPDVITMTFEDPKTERFAGEASHACCCCCCGCCCWLCCGIGACLQYAWQQTPAHQSTNYQLGNTFEELS